MSVERSNNWLGNSRADIPQLRSTDSSVCADFDVGFGSIISGKAPLIVSGFVTLTSNVINTPVTNLQISTAGSVVMHYLASENGTILNVPNDRAIETLNASNTRLQGAFTASATNYVGLDYLRSADPTTADVLQFLDSDTLQETPKRVPLARTLDYTLNISVQDFSVTPGICPLAIVVTDSENRIISITDARNMFCGLGSGGSVPNALFSYAWPGGRTSSVDNSVFTDGDKAIPSLHDWQVAVMSRIFELGGGERWFSPTADRNVIMTRTGSPLANGEFFSWVSGSSTLSWSGISFLFDNSTGSRNDVTSSSVVLPDGYCLYVDLDRTQNHISGTNALNAQIAPLATLGTPAVPGARWIMAWRLGSGNFCVYTRDTSFPVGSSYQPATQSALGITILNYGSYAAPAPIVAVTNSAGNVVGPGISRANAGGATAPGAGTLAIGPDTTDDLTLTIGNTASKTFAYGLQTLSSFNFSIGNGTDSLGDFNTNDSAYGGDIGACLNAVLAAIPSVGTAGKNANVLIKSGVYTATTGVSVPTGIGSLTITGEEGGVTIKSGGSVVLFTFGASGNSNILNFNRIHIIENSGSNTGKFMLTAGFSCTVNATDSILCSMTGPANSSIGSITGRFTNCTFLSNGINGCFVNARFEKCSFGVLTIGSPPIGNALAGAVLQDCVNVVFEQCVFSINKPWIQADNCNTVMLQNSYGQADLGAMIIGTTTACSNMTLRGCHLIQQGTTSTTTTSAMNSAVKSLNSGNSGIIVDGCILDNYDVGVYLQGCVNSKVVNNVINGTANSVTSRGVYGVVLGDGGTITGVSVCNNTITGLKDTRISGIVQTAGVYTGYSSALQIINIDNNQINSLSSNNAAAVQFFTSTANGVSICGNTISLDSFSESMAYGVYFEQSSGSSRTDVRINNNYIGCQIAGVSTSVTTTYATINNNTIYLLNGAGTATSVYGLYLLGVNITASGNSILGQATSSFITMYGIEVPAGNYMSLSGNNIDLVTPVGSGIRMGDTGGECDFASIANNTIKFSDQTQTAVLEGIILANAKSGNISNNLIYMDAPAVASIGISLQSVDYTSISGNAINSQVGAFTELTDYCVFNTVDNLSVIGNTVTTTKNGTACTIFSWTNPSDATSCLAISNVAYGNVSSMSIFGGSSPNVTSNVKLA